MVVSPLTGDGRSFFSSLHDQSARESPRTIARQREVRFMVSPPLVMTVPAEAHTPPPARVRVHVGVAAVTGGAGVRVPGTVIAAVKSGRVRLRIRPSDLVGIGVALHADRVATLKIVAGHAVFDVTPRKLR